MAGSALPSRERVRWEGSFSSVACVQATEVDGAGLAVFAGDGTPETVFATNAVAQRIEDLQFTTGEGHAGCGSLGCPRADAECRARPKGRWSGLAMELVEAGVGAIFAFPLRIGAVSLGTLDLHRHTPGELSDKQLAMALQTVDHASAVLLAVTAQALDSPPETTYRMVVHQCRRHGDGAAGHDHRGGPAAHAGDRLRRGHTHHELAADLVSRRRRLSKEEP